MYRAYLIVILLTSFALASTRAAQKPPDVSSLFAQLSQANTTDRAARQILEVASQYPDVRQYIVEKLPGMIDKTEIDKVWLNAVRLAGHLKASETVPSLQRAFSRGPLGRPAGTTLGAEMQLDDDVVAKALAEIGEPSLPAVKAFLKSSDRKDRRRAVLILLNMDAPESRKVLEEHLPHETDPKITRLIESGLRS
jgi:hypothetical protein